MKVKDNFILYHNMYPLIDELSDEQVGQVIKAIFRYSMEKKVEKFEKGSGQSLLYKSLVNSIDINNKKYEERCNTNRKNALNKWKSIAYDNREFTKESFITYCEDNGIEANFEDILLEEKELIATDNIFELKEKYNCKHINDETLKKMFT